MLATPKRKRVVATRSESISDAIASVTSTAEVRRAVAAASTVSRPATDLTSRGLQALLDTSMQQYLPSHPRLIVTVKPFGVMKKRLAEARVANLPDFISYVIRSWPTLAAQNRKAHQRNPTKSAGSSPMPTSPAFNVLAYRLNYFLAAYGSHLTNTSADASGKTDNDRRLEQLASQLAQARKENAMLRRLRRPARDSPSTITPNKPLPRITDDLLSDEWVPPVWSARDEKIKKA